MTGDGKITAFIVNNKAVVVGVLEIEEIEVEVLQEVFDAVEGVIEWRETRAGQVIGNIFIEGIAVRLEEQQEVFDWIVAIV